MCKLWSAIWGQQLQMSSLLRMLWPVWCAGARRRICPALGCPALRWAAWCWERGRRALGRSPVPPALPGEGLTAWLCFWLLNIIIIIISYNMCYSCSNHSLPCILYPLVSFLTGCPWFCASHPDRNDAQHPIGKVKVIYFLTKEPSFPLIIMRGLFCSPSEIQMWCTSDLFAREAAQSETESQAGRSMWEKRCLLETRPLKCIHVLKQNQPEETCDQGTCVRRQWKWNGRLNVWDTVWKGAVRGSGAGERSQERHRGKWKDETGGCQGGKGLTGVHRGKKWNREF